MNVWPSSSGSNKLCLLSPFALVSCSAYSLTLKMKATCSSETSVDFRRTTELECHSGHGAHGWAFFLSLFMLLLRCTDPPSRGSASCLKRSMLSEVYFELEHSTGPRDCSIGSNSLYVGVLISLWLFLFHLRVVCSTTKRFFLGWVKYE
jgi:hypothetical protein